MLLVICTADLIPIKLCIDFNYVFNLLLVCQRDDDDDVEVVLAEGFIAVSLNFYSLYADNTAVLACLSIKHSSEQNEPINRVNFEKCGERYLMM